MAAPYGSLRIWADSQIIPVSDQVELTRQDFSCNSRGLNILVSCHVGVHDIVVSPSGHFRSLKSHVRHVNGFYLRWPFLVCHAWQPASVSQASSSNIYSGEPDEELFVKNPTF